MRKTLRFPVVWMILCGLAGAARGATLSEQLMARHPSNRGVLTTSVPEPIFGELVGRLAPPESGGTEATAYRFLAEYGRLVGLPADVDPRRALAVVESGSAGRGSTLVLAPVVDDLPVPASEVAFNFGGDGQLVGVTGSYRAPPEVVKPAITPGRAVELALADTREKYGRGARLMGDGELRESLALGTDGKLHHRYALRVTIDGPTTQRDVLVDGSGAVIENVELRNAAVPVEGGGGFVGTVIDEQAYPYRQSYVQPTKSVAIDHLLTHNTRLSQRLRGTFARSITPGGAASRSGRFDFPPTRAVSGFWGNQPQGENPPFLDTTAYHFITLAARFALENGITEVQTHPVKYDVVALADEDNAWHDGSNSTIYFAWKNPKMNQHPARDPTTVWHEYGHHLVHILNPGLTRVWFDAEGALQQQAVNEGFADFFTASLSNSPIIGSQFLQLCLGGLRNCANQVRYPDDFVDEPHAVGMIVSGILWDIRSKLGPERTLRLAIQAIRKVRKPAYFGAFISALNQADIVLHEGEHLSTIAEACRAHGLDPDLPGRQWPWPAGKTPVPIKAWGFPRSKRLWEVGTVLLSSRVWGPSGCWTAGRTFTGPYFLTDAVAAIPAPGPSASAVPPRPPPEPAIPRQDTPGGRRAPK